MSLLIINAFSQNQAKGQFLSQQLQQYYQAQEIEYHIFNLHECEIKMCIVCGSCNSETPGECILKDEMNKIFPLWIRAEQIIILTPVVFGTYPSILKKLMDRLMPIKVGLYTLYKGELHHLNRYQNKAALYVYGCLQTNNQRQAETFRLLVKRNAINILLDEFKAFIFSETSSEDEIKSLLPA